MVASGKSLNPDPQLVGRDEELGRLRALLDGARAGTGGSLVLEGEAGIGKTSLLTEATAMATGFTSLATVGIESEAALGCAGLLDVLTPLRERLSEIPTVQAEALSAVLGWGPAHTTADPFLVAAGTLSLLARQAERQPVLVRVDDAHWVDQTSLAALAFAARRLTFDAVAFLFAARSGSAALAQLSGLPVLAIEGVPSSVAAQLLPGDTATTVVDRLTETTHGNPLALLEVGRTLTDAQRLGAATLPERLPVGTRVEKAFETVLLQRSPECRRALLLCAVDASASPVAPVAAMAHSGDDAGAALAEAEQAGIVVLDGQGLRFRHPLLRTAVLAAATADERRAAHRALASVIPPDSDTALHTWHLAQGTVGPDDVLAAELVGVAASRRVRSGYAESSVVLERAALLGSDPEVASERLALAVEDAFLAGDLHRTRSLAATVLQSPASSRTRGHVQLTLGTMEMYAGSVRRSAGLLFAAADGCDGLQRVWALTELAEAHFRLGEYDHLPTTARRIQEVADHADPQQRLLSSFVQGIALSSAGDPVAGAARFEDVVRLATGQLTMDNPRLLIPWAMAIAHLGIGDAVMADADPVLRDARRRGAIGILVPLLSMSAAARAWLGDQAGAFADAGEATELGEHLGYAADTAVALEMVAWQSAARGRHDDARVALERAVALTDRAETTTVHAHHAITAAFCALSRHQPAEAADLLEQRIAADGGIGSMGEPLGVAPQLIEAYAALGRTADAATLARRYVAETQPVSAHDRALVECSLALATVDDDTAFAAYDRALVAHEQDTNRFEAARTRLLYGERLRRAGRRVDARVQLRAALDEFAASDLLAWADRAAQELDATGATARSRGPVPEEPLTSQETRVALLVAKGQSNKEVAAALFLSPKTVEHHLGSVFRKRGYRSRAELAAALARSAPPG